MKGVRAIKQEIAALLLSLEGLSRWTSRDTNMVSMVVTSKKMTRGTEELGPGLSIDP